MVEAKNEATTKNPANAGFLAMVRLLSLDPPINMVRVKDIQVLCRSQMWNVFFGNQLKDLFLGKRIACRVQIGDQFGDPIDFAHLTTSR